MMRGHRYVGLIVREEGRHFGGRSAPSPPALVVQQAPPAPTPDTTEVQKKAAEEAIARKTKQRGYRSTVLASRFIPDTSTSDSTSGLKNTLGS